MQRDPAQRLGARRTSDVRSHPWFSGMDWEKILRREVEVPPLRRLVKQPSDSGTGSPTSTKVPSPFEGRFEAQVRKSMNSASEVPGWEFASPAPSPAGSSAPALTTTASLASSSAAPQVPAVQDVSATQPAQEDEEDTSPAATSQSSHEQLARKQKSSSSRRNPGAVHSAGMLPVF